MENSKCGKRSNEPGRVCSSCGGSGRANAHGDCMACGGTGRAVVVSMPIQQPAPPPAEHARLCATCNQQAQLESGLKHAVDDAVATLNKVETERDELRRKLGQTKLDFANACDRGRRLEAKLEAAEAELSNAHRLARKNARLAGATRRCLVGFLEDFPRYFGKNDNALLDAAHETRAALTELWKESDQSRPSTAARSGSVGGEAAAQSSGTTPPLVPARNCLGHAERDHQKWMQRYDGEQGTFEDSRFSWLLSAVDDIARHLEAQRPLTLADVDRRIAELARAALHDKRGCGDLSKLADAAEAAAEKAGKP